MRKVKIIFSFIIVVFLVTGCRSLPKSSLFENQLKNVKSLEPDVIRKSRSLKKTYNATFNRTWKETITILTQYAVIPKISKVSERVGTITYIDVDGFYYYDRWKTTSEMTQKEEDVEVRRVFSAELAFTVLIEEKQADKSEVYVLPMMELLGTEIPDEKMKILTAAFTEKAGQLLERISTQLSAKERWGWLRE